MLRNYVAILLFSSFCLQSGFVYSYEDIEESTFYEDTTSKVRIVSHGKRFYLKENEENEDSFDKVFHFYLGDTEIWSYKGIDENIFDISGVYPSIDNAKLLVFGMVRGGRSCLGEFWVMEIHSKDKATVTGPFGTCFGIVKPGALKGVTENPIYNEKDNTWKIGLYIDMEGSGVEWWYYKNGEVWIEGQTIEQSKRDEDWEWRMKFKNSVTDPTERDYYLDKTDGDYRTAYYIWLRESAQDIDPNKFR